MKLNKTEKIAYDWLIENGYDKNDLIRERASQSPDFLIRGTNKGIEVKKIYGSNLILVPESQGKKLDKYDTDIIAFDNDGKFVEKFSWNKRNNQIVNLNVYKLTIKSVGIREETYNALRKYAVHKWGHFVGDDISFTRIIDNLLLEVKKK